MNHCLLLKLEKKNKPKKNKLENIKSDKKIVQHSLANGLLVSIEEDFRLPMIAFSCAFKAGLFADHHHGHGMTQLLSRALLKGTNKNEADQIAVKIESLGGNISVIGGNNSLSLNSDFLSNDFNQAFDIVSDVIMNPIFPQSAVNREKETLLLDIEEERESPLSLAAIFARENIFGNHPHRYSRLGTVDVIKESDSEKLLNFYSEYGVSNNGVITLCGAIDSNKVINKIEDCLSNIKTGEAMNTNFEDPQWPLKEKEVEIKHHKEQAVVMIAFPGLSINSDERATISVIEEIAGGMDGLLFARIREELGLAYYVGMSQMVGYSSGSILFYAGTNSESVLKVQNELNLIIESLIKEKIGEDVLTRAKNSLIGKYALSKQSLSARSQSMALNLLYGLGERYDDENIEKIKRLTSEDLRKCCQKYFATSSKVTVQVIPNNK